MERERRNIRKQSEKKIKTVTKLVKDEWKNLLKLCGFGGGGVLTTIYGIYLFTQGELMTTIYNVLGFVLGWFSFLGYAKVIYIFFLCGSDGRYDLLKILLTMFFIMSMAFTAVNRKVFYENVSAFIWWMNLFRYCCGIGELKILDLLPDDHPDKKPKQDDVRRRIVRSGNAISGPTADEFMMDPNEEDSGSMKQKERSGICPHCKRDLDEKIDENYDDEDEDHEDDRFDDLGVRRRSEDVVNRGEYDDDDVYKGFHDQ